jgi:hypothetical protein
MLVLVLRHLLFLIAIFPAACGGKAIPPDGTDPDAGSFGRGPEGGSADGNGYVDPHCPDAAPPPVSINCDVFDPKSCLSGEACYPMVIPPKYKCQSETYGAFCASQGTGTQGSPCGSGSGCAGGFVCLITGASTECAKMCEFGSGTHSCPDGFVCEPIDIPGFAACL